MFYLSNFSALFPSFSKEVVKLVGERERLYHTAVEPECRSFC